MKPKTEIPSYRRQRCQVSTLLLVVFILVVFIMVVARGLSARESPTEQNLSIVVMVQNYTQIDSQALDWSERDAAMIFRAAGIRILWVEGPTSGRQPHRHWLDSANALPDISLRLVTGSMARKFRVPREVMGSALPCSPRRYRMLGHGIVSSG